MSWQGPRGGRGWTKEEWDACEAAWKRRFEGTTVPEMDCNKTEAYWFVNGYMEAQEDAEKQNKLLKDIFDYMSKAAEQCFSVLPQKLEDRLRALMSKNE